MPPHFDSPLGVASFEKPAAAPPALAVRSEYLSAEMLSALGVSTAAGLTVMTLDKGVRPVVEAYVVKTRGGAGGGTGDVSSLAIEKSKGEAGCDSDSDSDDEVSEAQCCPSKKPTRTKALTAVSLGLGAHAFVHNDETLWVVNQLVGAPVGTQCSAAMYTESMMVARGGGRGEVLRALCEVLLEESERHREHTFRMYQWNVQYGFWRHAGVRSARPVSSVVVPETMKALTVDDMGGFLSSKTRRFYLKHGIPYKRAYLFWGVPGTGKTSLIQALAGEYKRSVCFMQPTDPKFTDDMLRDAVSYAPAKSIIVFEDIDALFTQGRENRGKSAVTFSGLLNALDGVGMKEGQVFILTTNFREQLDAALIRNGRVDVHVEFNHIQAAEQKEMFRRFYPADAGLAEAFLARLEKELGAKAKELTPAALQHYFILHQKDSGAEAIAGVAEIGSEMKRREETEEEDKKKKAGEEEKKKEDKEDTEEKAKPSREGTSFEWHLSVSNTVALMVLGVVCLPILIRHQARKA